MENRILWVCVCTKVCCFSIIEPAILCSSCESFIRCQPFRVCVWFHLLEFQNEMKREFSTKQTKSWKLPSNRLTLSGWKNIRREKSAWIHTVKMIHTTSIPNKAKRTFISGVLLLENRRHGNACSLTNRILYQIKNEKTLFSSRQKKNTMCAGIMMGMKLKIQKQIINYDLWHKLFDSSNSGGFVNATIKTILRLKSTVKKEPNGKIPRVHKTIFAQFLFSHLIHLDQSDVRLAQK